MWEGGNINKCKKCGKEIPNYVYIDGYRRNIHNRCYCLDCVPFKDFRNQILLDDNKRRNLNKSKIAKFTKEELQKIFDTSDNYKEVLQKIGLSSNSNNYNTLNRYIKELSIDLSKINMNRLKKQKITSNVSSRQGKDFYALVKQGELNWSPSKLLNKLVENNIKEYKCEECGISEYNGKPLRLELHHKDGNKMNNKLENLEMLCPNCHSQTDNFRFKNRKHK